MLFMSYVIFLQPLCKSSLNTFKVINCGVLTTQKITLLVIAL